MNQALKTTTPATDDTRLPRMIVTGEFSAGKTRFINGLLGRDVLPSNVTSTSLPPVWLIYGNDVSFRIDLEGQVHPVATIEEVAVEDTLVYVNAVEADVLRHMDIIDTPGNSDPNIPPICWERMVGHADMMVWCTGATQAWRQSEKATVRGLPETLRTQGMLLITQADRIEEDSQEKLQRRVTRDASQFLSKIRMASLIDPEQVKALTTEIVQMADAVSDRPGLALDAVEAARPAIPVIVPAAEPVAEAAPEAASEPAAKADAKTAKAKAPGLSMADMIKDHGTETDAKADIAASIIGKLTAAIIVDEDENDTESAHADAALPQVEPDTANEVPVASLSEAETEDGDVHADLINVVTKLEGKRRVTRRRKPKFAEEEAEADAETTPATKTASDAVSNASTAADDSPELTTRILWDELTADRKLDDVEDITASVETFIACVDRLLMPKNGKIGKTDVIAAMKDAAASELTSAT